MPKASERYFYVDEVPPATPVTYVDKNGNPLSTIDGLTIVAKCLIEPGVSGTVGTEFDVPCSTPSGGVFEIQWPDPSGFDRAGMMKIDMEVDGDWFLDRRFAEIRDR